MLLNIFSSFRFKQGVFIIIICFFYTISAIGSNAPVEALALTNNQTELLDAKFAAALKQYGIVGQSIAILQNGQLVYRRSMGLDDITQQTKVTNDTVYSVYSVTKLFVITLVLDLVEKNKIQLDEKIGHYLKNIPTAWQSITIRQLLSHTSGLPEYFSIDIPLPKSQELAIEKMADEPFQFTTGSKSKYNQTGFLLIKILIEQQTKQDFVSAINTLIIKKLKLDHSSFGGGDVDIVDRTNHFYGFENGQLKDRGIFPFPRYTFAGSGLNSNTADLAKWFSALVSGNIISKNLLFRSWQPVYYTDGTISDYVNGWQYNINKKVTTIGHLGGNDINLRHVFFNNDPSKAITVIHLTNGRANAAFNMEEFSITLADVIMPGLMSKVVELKYQMHELIDMNKMEKAISIYHTFKQAASVKNISTQDAMNSLGYELMLSNEKTTEAIQIFKLNVLAYPQSANAYDSLAESYLKAGNNKFAVKFYSKALEINPKLNYIPTILKNLKAKLSILNNKMDTQ
jgi:D-alanyl-D-alanine carboxypeptidase